MWNIRSVFRHLSNTSKMECICKKIGRFFNKIKTNDETASVTSAYLCIFWVQPRMKLVLIPLDTTPHLLFKDFIFHINLFD